MNDLPSRLDDDVDPAPRILRLVAQALSHSRGVLRGKGKDPDVKALRWVADCLEGKTMSSEDANSYMGRAISQERRVRKLIQTSNTRWEVVRAKLKAREEAPLSPADELALKQAMESGAFEEEDVE